MVKVPIPYTAFLIWQERRSMMDAANTVLRAGWQMALGFASSSRSSRLRHARPDSE